MPFAETLSQASLGSAAGEVAMQYWLGFGGFVLALLALDMFVFHRESHAPTLRESAGWVVFWCSLAIGFNALIWWWRGSRAGMEFLAGYLVEWSLSMDNVFVFAVIFRFFRVPLMYQYRVLFWGIVGAIGLRLTFILAGTALIQRFDWVLPIFGLFLVYTALRLLRHSVDEEVHPDRNVLLRMARRLFRVSSGDHRQHGHRFLVRENGRLCVTPMLLVLLVVESSDVMFAVDSVPAIFGITRDPFIVFTSNIFAILGLRALYFLLAGAIEMFSLLHYGLAGVLGFVGIKMIVESKMVLQWWRPHTEQEHLIPIWASLLVIVALLGTSILASLVVQHGEGQGVEGSDDTGGRPSA